MRIGVYLGGSRPTAGGGHYFERTLLKTISRRAGECQHEFVVFHWGKARDSREKIRYVNLSKNWRGRLGRRLWFLAAWGRDWWSGKGAVESALGYLLLGEIQRHKVDVMWYLTPSCPTREVPYITVVWDLQFRIQPFWPEMSSNGQWARQEQAYKVNIQRASGIVTGTKVGKEEIISMYGAREDRIIMAPHPTPEDALGWRGESFGVREKFGIKGNFFLYPAQFWAHKNHVGLLEAMRLLKKRWDERLLLVLVGSDKGNREYARQKIVDFGLEQEVRTLDFVEREDLLALYKEARALVYPSFCGPENLPPLEAFALGCPVLAADIPGAREQLGEAALLFDPKSPKDMADKMMGFLRDNGLARDLISRGRKVAEARQPDNFFNKVIDFIDDFAVYRKAWS